MNHDLDPEENDAELYVAGQKLKATALKPGSRVGLVAPGSRPESPRVFKRCLQIVEEMGYVPLAGESVLKYNGFSAGSDKERLEDFHAFLHDDSVEALLFVTGGYGALRLLPVLDFSHIRKNPKLYLGSGDNDSILLAINELTGLVVFHGPNLDQIDDRHSFDSVKKTLSGDGLQEISCRDDSDPAFERAAYSLSDKICSGISCGGNLSALTSLFGSRYQPQMQNKILLLDDFAERYSFLDRWFTTLYLAGTLTQVAGIAFGEFPNCGIRGADNMLSIEDTFGDRIKELGLAACFGFKFGMASKNNVIPLGINTELDCGAGKLKFLESTLS